MLDHLIRSARSHLGDAAQCGAGPSGDFGVFVPEERFVQLVGVSCLNTPAA